MSLSATTILTAIAALSPAGITEIYTFDDAPVDMTRAKLPCIAPDLDAWTPNNAAEESGGETFGLSTQRFWHVDRGLGFILFLAQIGANRKNPYQEQNNVSDLKDALIEALLELDVTGVDVLSVTGGEQAQIADLSGHVFHACRLSVQVREDVNP
jgi:hypothetical protein